MTPDPFGRDKTVSLCDGSVVSTWSAEWRAECLDCHRDAVAVLALTDREARRRRIGVLADRRGEVYRSRLEAEVMRVWGVRRAAVLSGESNA